jgi:O-antigen/teichoic acid export membrane protein
VAQQLAHFTSEIHRDQDMTPAPAPEPSPNDTVKELFFKGSAWTLLAFGSTQLMRLASNTILWKLLSAEAFGLMAIVTALMVGLYMFSDVGIGPSIVQHERGDDPDYLNTAWTIQVIRSICLTLIGLLLAVPAAHFYRQTQLAPLIAVVALAPLFQAFNSTKLFSASRHLALKQVAIIEIVSWATGAVATLVVAWITRSPMALTLNWVVSAALRLAMGHLMLPGIRNRFRWDRTAATAMLRFGRWVFLSTLLTFLAVNSDRLIFGRLLPIDLLGVYGIAGIWATIPGQILNKVFNTVAFPVLSRAKNLGQAVGPVFLETRGKALIAGAWATTGVIAGAGPLIRVFYDHRALDAIWIIPLLAMGGWFADLENSNSAASLALGRPKWLAAANGAKVVGMTVLVPIGAWLGGFAGAIAGFAAADMFKYLVSAVGAAGMGLSAWRQDLVLTLGIVGVSVATLAVRTAIGAEHLRPIVDALIVTVLVTAGWGVIWVLRSRLGRRAS